MTTVPGTSSNTDLASILAAAFHEFEMLRKAARLREDQDPDLFPAFLLAGSAAVDGRNSLVTAPSFPPGPQPPGPAPVLAAGTDPASATDAIAAHAAALAEQRPGNMCRAFVPVLAPPAASIRKPRSPPLTRS